MIIDDRAHLGLIGDGLLRHLSVMGQIGPRVGADTGGPDTGLCLAVARAFLLECERAGAVPFGLPHLPFIANRSLWSGEIPPGGYLGDYPLLPRSTVVRSFDAMWTLQHTRGSAKGPVLRAMTWMCCEAGLEAAVRYLFDLQRVGFISGAKTLGDNLVLLITLRGLVQQDRELASLVFVEAPTTNRQWLEVDFREGFGVGDAAVQDEVGGADLILQECFETMRRCREAANYDEWLVGQLNQFAILSTALNVLKSLVPEPTLSVRALFDMIEEVMADALTFRSGAVGGPLLQSSFHLARHVSNEIAALDHHGWKQRVIGERLVVPHALQHLLDRHDWLVADGAFEKPLDLSADLPRQWLGVSPDVAYSVHLSMRGKKPSPWTPLVLPHIGASRRPDESVDIEADNEESRRVWEAGVQEIENTRREALAKEARGQLGPALDAYRRILSRHPWCHVLRDAAAHVQLLQEDIEGAVAEMRRAVLGDPTEPGHWRALEEICRAAGLPTSATIAGVLRNRFAG